MRDEEEGKSAYDFTVLCVYSDKGNGYFSSHHC